MNIRRYIIVCSMTCAKALCVCVCMSVCLSICLSFCLSVCLSNLSTCVSVCLCVCVCLWTRLNEHVFIPEYMHGQCTFVTWHELAKHVFLRLPFSEMMQCTECRHCRRYVTNLYISEGRDLEVKLSDAGGPSGDHHDHEQPSQAQAVVSASVAAEAKKAPRNQTKKKEVKKSVGKSPKTPSNAAKKCDLRLWISLYRKGQYRVLGGNRVFCETCVSTAFHQSH